MADPIYIHEIEQQATLFALDALTAEEKETFARRLEAGCALCTSEVEQCNLTMSMLPLSLPTVAPPPSLRARLLESIQRDNEQASSAGQMTLVRSDETPWKFSFPGVETRYLYKRKTMLVRMAAQSRIPAHMHSTAEQCLVLEGSVNSGGITANAGDFIHMPAGSRHADIETRDGAVLLIAYA